jgi:hypothetical protein
VGRAVADSQVTEVTQSFAAFVLTRDRGRILTDCVAKRRIIKLLTGPKWSGSEEDCEFILRHLALAYSGYPGFRDEWRPASAGSNQAGRKQ